MAQVVNGHWTNDNAKAFLFRIAFDFVAQLERMMDEEGVSSSELAKRLKVSKGRVSQIMNNPGNMTLKTVVDWARALNVKVAIVAYDDGDVDNDNGPVNAQIFSKCWEKAGRPTDFFAAGMVAASTSEVEIGERWTDWARQIRPEAECEQEVDTWQVIDPALAAMLQRLSIRGVDQHAGTNAT